MCVGKLQSNGGEATNEHAEAAQQSPQERGSIDRRPSSMAEDSSEHRIKLQGELEVGKRAMS